MPSKKLRITLSLNFLVAILFTSLVACGIKGEPLPPEKKVDIGRGQPTYRRATEKIKLEKYQSIDDAEKPQREPEDE